MVKRAQTIKQWTVPLEDAAALAEELAVLAELADEEDDEDAAAEVAEQV